MREAGALARATVARAVQALDQGHGQFAGERGRHRGQRFPARAAGATRARRRLAVGGDRGRSRRALDAAASGSSIRSTAPAPIIAGRADWPISVALVEDGRPVARRALCAGDRRDVPRGARATARRSTARRSRPAPATASTAPRLAGPKRYLDRLAGTGAGHRCRSRKVHSLALRLARVAHGALDAAFAVARQPRLGPCGCRPFGARSRRRADRFRRADARSTIGPHPVHGALVAAGRARHAALLDLVRDRTPRVRVSSPRPRIAAAHCEGSSHVRTSPQSNCCISCSAASSTELDGTEFKDLDKVDIVGVYPNYATAYAAWKAKAQQTVDNAHMRYFIVHLHRLLDPDSAGRAGALSRAPMPSLKRIVTSPRVPGGRRHGRRRSICAWSGSTTRLDHRAGRHLRHASSMPVIIAMWHGQHFLTPFIKRDTSTSRQGADLAPPRRRDQRASPPSGSASAPSAAPARTAANSTARAASAPSPRCSTRSRRLQCRADRRRAEGRARRRARHRQARAAFRPADLSGRDRHQPAHRARQLGPHRDQPAVRPHRRWWRASRSTCRATPTTRRWKPRGARSRTRSTRATARAYEIADGTRSDAGRERPAAAARCAPTGCCRRRRRRWRRCCWRGGCGAARSIAQRLPSGAAKARMRAPARPAGLAAWRQRRRTAQRAAADRAHRARDVSVLVTSGTVTSARARRAAAAARRHPSIRAARRAALRARASSTTGGPTSRCSSNPICGRT